MSNTKRNVLIASGSALALSGLGAVGCAVTANMDHSGPNAPSFKPFGRSFNKALVLSSGGPRGFVHVGVLKGLEQIGWKPELVAGSSVGALVGALYAAGVPVADIERMALELGPTDFVRFNPFGKEKLSGTALADIVNERLNQMPMERFAIPFMACVLVQSTRQLAAFNCGDAGVAVQASAAIEGQFSPVNIRGVAHVDADLAEPMPVRSAKREGAKRVLAVDASAHEADAPAGTERWRAGDLQKRALTTPDAQAADLVIHPKFGYYVNISREFRERAIQAGLRDTLAAAKRIEAVFA